MKKVLILCAPEIPAVRRWRRRFGRMLGNSDWVAVSAGSRPSGYVHPLALRSIEELGLSVDGLESKSVELFVGDQRSIWQ